MLTLGRCLSVFERRLRSASGMLMANMQSEAVFVRHSFMHYRSQWSPAQLGARDAMYIVLPSNDFCQNED